MIRPRFRARIVSLSAIFGASLPLAGTAVAADAVAQVTQIAGRPVASAGGAKRALDVGAVVAARDVVSTDGKGRTVMRFTDETVLSVGANTAVTVESFTPGGASAPAVIRATRGTLRFAAGRGGPEAYRIETPAATIGATGAVLDARVEAGRVQVSVTQGGIVVCPQHGRPEFADCVEATTGQTVTATATRAKVVSTDTAPAMHADLLPLTGAAGAPAGAASTGAAQAVGGAVKAVSGVAGVFNSLTTKVLGATGKVGGTVLNGTVGEAVKPAGGYSDDPVMPESRPED